MLFIILIPAALTYTYGRMVGSRRQGWAIFAAMAVLYVGGVAVAYNAEQHGTPAQHAAGVSTHADRRLHRRQHGRQGAAQRDRQLRTVGDDDDGHLQRLGQRRDGVVHRAGRRRPDGRPGVQRGGLRRRRHRPVLDARLRPAGGVHRRADGRAHARVPGQEDRSQRDQARLAGGALHAAGGAGHRRRRDREPGRAHLDLRQGARKASPRPSTPTCPRPTTTARPSPATPATSSRTRATSAPTA